MATVSEATVIAGVLGSIIGYIGSEVAEEILFERLLWPQRFYNDLNVSIFLKMGFLMSMGGPLHKAALATLDKFQDSGLYGGKCRGNMLGTAFLSDLHVNYFLRSHENEQNVKKEARNGFWVRALRNIRGGPLPADNADAEAAIRASRKLRAYQYLHYLQLRHVPRGEPVDTRATVVKEDSLSFRSFVGLFASELVPLGVAMFAGIHLKCVWFAVYICIPSFLKILAALVSVRRDGVEDPQQNDNLQDEIFEIEYENHGFAVIEGPEDVVRQFFRHYGHPTRDWRETLFGDRMKELLSILIIYLFVLYFPAGLLSVLWMKPEVQYLWLGYEIYSILVMHVVRLAGWSGCGRTEEHVARMLQGHREVCLKSKNGNAVIATVQTEAVDNVQTGRMRVQELIDGFMLRRASQERTTVTESGSAATPIEGNGHEFQLSKALEPFFPPPANEDGIKSMPHLGGKMDPLKVPTDAATVPKIIKRRKIEPPAENPEDLAEVDRLPLRALEGGTGFRNNVELGRPDSPNEGVLNKDEKADPAEINVVKAKDVPDPLLAIPRTGNDTKSLEPIVVDRPEPPKETLQNDSEDTKSTQKPIENEKAEPLLSPELLTVDGKNLREDVLPSDSNLKKRGCRTKMDPISQPKP